MSIAKKAFDPVNIVYCDFKEKKSILEAHYHFCTALFVSHCDLCIVLCCSGEAFLVLPTDIWGDTYFVFSSPDVYDVADDDYNVANGSQFSKYYHNK